MMRLMGLIKKEMLQIIRDPSAILIAFVLPLLLLFIFGYGVNLDTNRVKIGLVLENRSPDIDSLATAFTHSRFIDARIGTDRREFVEDLTGGRIRGIVVIPADFNVRLSTDQSASIQVITDGSEPNIASFVENYARGIIQVWLTYQQQDRGVNFEPPIELASRFWYNPELKSRHFLIPGSIAIVMALIGTILTALVVAREWERGTMEAMMATPVTITEIILGKLVPYFLLGIGSMMVCFVVAVFWYDIPFRGAFPALLLTTAIFLVASLGQGLLISTLTKNQFMASQIALMSAFLPAFMLSGFFFEISAMPGPIRAITYLFAARYFVTSLQTLFLVGNIWSLLIFCMMLMLIIGSVFFILTRAKTVKRLE